MELMGPCGICANCCRILHVQGSSRQERNGKQPVCTPAGADLLPPSHCRQTRHNPSLPAQSPPSVRVPHRITGIIAFSDIPASHRRSLSSPRAQFDAPERSVHVRVAEHAGHIYLDLADDLWRAVEIGPDGWRVNRFPPVRFRRPAGMLPLPFPQHGGSIEALLPFLNLSSRNDFVLVVAWLMATLRSLTNIRVVRDPESPRGWTVALDRFPGWKETPAWFTPAPEWRAHVEGAGTP